MAFQKRDWVLITAFENRTGEELLDGTVEAALGRELANSRFVNVVPRTRIGDALRLMRRPLGSAAGENEVLPAVRRMSSQVRRLLDEALSRLEALDAEMSRVVKLRCFAGLTIEETAQALQTSQRTASRLWRILRNASTESSPE